MNRRASFVWLWVIGLFWLAPEQTAAQTQEPEAETASGSTASNLWLVLGGSQTTVRGDCTFCEVQEVDARYSHTWSVLANVGGRVNDRTDVGGEVVWVPGRTRGGASIRATFLLGVVQFRPWASQGFFVKGGMGMAFLRNFLLEDSTVTQKALGAVIGGGWAFRTDKRVGFQLHASQYAAALGDFDTGLGELENVLGNIWTLGGAVVIR